MKVAILLGKPYARLHANIKETRSTQRSRLDFYGTSTQTHTHTLADAIYLNGDVIFNTVYTVKHIKYRSQSDLLICVFLEMHMSDVLTFTDTYIHCGLVVGLQDLQSQGCGF